MNDQLRRDAEAIARAAIDAVRPDAAVWRALEQVNLPRRIYLVAVGKAAWQMASAAMKYLNRPIERGIVLTKYGHIQGDLDRIACYEAGHPIPDENSFIGTQAILDMTSGLKETDTVLFLLSGGGSALFEKPLVSPASLRKVTQALLSGGADIVEINTVRKRLSAVKGGRFADWCYPANIEAVILSDILGDPVDMIASGPAVADPSNCEQALAIAEKYSLLGISGVKEHLCQETPKQVNNVHTQVIGSVRELCRAARAKAEAMGYRPVFLTDHLDCEAREAGRYIAEILRQNHQSGKRLAFIAGGETVVHVKGNGLGGRNQELVLATAEGIAGLANVAVISVGSDGTDVYMVRGCIPNSV